MWPQIGIGQNYDPFSQFQVMPQMTGLAGGIGSEWWMPQLSEGFGSMFQIAAIPGALNDIFTYRDPEQSAIGGGLQGALQGLSVGSMWGPWGAGIGAGLGFLAGKR